MAQPSIKITLLNCSSEKDGIYCSAQIEQQDDMQFVPLQVVGVEIDNGQVHRVNADTDSYCSFVGKEMNSCLPSDHEALVVFDDQGELDRLSKTQEAWNKHAYDFVRVWLGYTFPEKRFNYTINDRKGEIKVFKPVNLFSHTFADTTATKFILFSLNYYTGEFEDYHGHHFIVSEGGMKKMEDVLTNVCRCGHYKANACCVGKRAVVKKKLGAMGD